MTLPADRPNFSPECRTSPAGPVIPLRSGFAGCHSLAHSASIRGVFQKAPRSYPGFGSRITGFCNGSM